ncbi:hypothetical protein S83_001570, partial [Arachis hypogaea]
VLNIPTMINNGTFEIITPVELIKKGDKVVFSPEFLDLTDDDLVEEFAIGVSMVTALSLAISYPTLAAAPHMFINAYKNVLSVAIETDYSFPEADKVTEYLKFDNKKLEALKKSKDRSAEMQENEIVLSCNLFRDASKNSKLVQSEGNSRYSLRAIRKSDLVGLYFNREMEG